MCVEQWHHVNTPRSCECIPTIFQARTPKWIFSLELEEKVAIESRAKYHKLMWPEGNVYDVSGHACDERNKERKKQIRIMRLINRLKQVQCMLKHLYKQMGSFL